MSKFTPRPWKVKHLTIKADHPLSRKSLIATVSIEGVDSECAIANAHLIAAAPELYEYGYDLAMLVLQSDFYQKPDVKEAVDNLLTIIDKAKDKQTI